MNGVYDIGYHGLGLPLQLSVVMPTFNRAGYIAEALDSLAAQTEPPLEVIVVDDRSTDDTRERVEHHPLAGRIRYHLQERNQGASVARNTGVGIARGDVIVFLDSDDILEPQHHGVVGDIMRAHPGVGLVCTDASLIGEAGQHLSLETFTSIQAAIKGVRIASGVRSLEQVFTFSTSFPGLSIRRDLYQQVGGLDQSLFPLDDYDLQLKVAASRSSVYYEHRPLARYRIHGTNESGSARAARTCERKLACLRLALERYPSLRAPGSSAWRRLAEARRELAYALLRDGKLAPAAWQLARSLAQDPRAGARDLVRLLRLRVTRLGQPSG